MQIRLGDKVQARDARSNAMTGSVIKIINAKSRVASAVIYTVEWDNGCTGKHSIMGIRRAD